MANKKLARVMFKHSTNNKKSTTRSPSPRVLVATILMGLFEAVLLRSLACLDRVANNKRQIEIDAIFGPDLFCFLKSEQVQ